MFASYAHADSEKVRPELEAIGHLFPVWYDDNIRPGSRWNDELASAIVDCAAFVLFVTPNSTASAHCLRELQFALAESKPLIAIHLVPTELPDGLRFALGDTQAILKYTLTSQRYEARLEATFRELGTQTSAKPWEPIPRPDAVVADRPSIAVLPFTVLSNNADTEAFALGMSEDLTTLLSRVPAFFVVSRQSAASLAAETTDTQILGRKLRVRYLVSGTVRTAGPRMRVSAQLIDAHNGATLWANAFDRNLADVFVLQDELTRRIVGQLHPELIVADLNYGRVTDNYTSWRRIADAMLQYGHSPDPQHIDDLATIVDDILQTDPEYAPAHALHAFTIARRRNWGELSNVDAERCERAAKRALEIAPQDPTVLFFIAGVEQAMGRRANGERLALQAADREPSNAAFQATAGFILTLGGKMQAGIERLHLAVQLSPSDPLRAQSLFQLGGALFQARRFAEAREVLDENLRLQPDNTWAWLLYAGVSQHLEDMQATVLAIERIKELSDWNADHFRLMLERILADVWREGSEIRTLWEETLNALQGYGL